MMVQAFFGVLLITIVVFLGVYGFARLTLGP
jgi:hypothetical protein